MPMDSHEERQPRPTEQSLQTLLAQRLPFWLNLTETEKHAVVAHTRPAAFRAGERVSTPQNPAGIMLVLSGGLRAYIISEEGKQITLFRVNMKESCVLAASGTLSLTTFDVFFDAEEDTSMLIIDASFYAGLMEQNIYVEAFTYHQTVERFSEVMWVMEQVLFMSFDKRLAVFLLDEVARTNSTTLSMTHDEIAHHLGSAREVVSRMLKRFASDGLVLLSRGSIEVTDKQGLYDLIG